MSFISNGVEYALHCLLFLVGKPGAMAEANVRDLAELQGVSTEYLAKIFTRLSRAGLVIASEGARGGFVLARNAKKISFLDVVLAIDGPKTLFACREIRSNCALFGQRAPRWATDGHCSIHTVMMEAEEKMRAELAAHTLAELAEQVAEKAPQEFAQQVEDWFEERRSGR